MIGVGDSQAVRLSIEHMINDSILPRPDYSIDEVALDQHTILEITVRRGGNGPYLYKGHAYRRMDTSTEEVQEAELFELMLKKRNLSYDAVEGSSQALVFTTLERLALEKLSITKFDQNILVTLGLYKNGKYNVAAELLSDAPALVNAVVDITRFGETTSILLDRIRIEKCSVLTQYQKTIELFSVYYKPVQLIQGLERVSKIRVPDSAYRESVANAILHRDYLAGGNIQIAMFQDRIEISSPGGLPNGMTRDHYLNELISVPRNPILAGVFFRLGLIELFGTGIIRIKEAYAGYAVKPRFTIDESRILVVLPVIPIDGVLSDTDMILNYLATHDVITRSIAEKVTKKSKSQVFVLLSQLVEAKKIYKVGLGPATRYQLSP